MRYDAATGMLHADARDYSPTLERWVQQDPAGYVNGADLYQSEESNPVGHLYPSGMYDAAGHFYTVYMVAISSGMSPAKAYELAYFAQLPDQVEDFDAVSAGANMARVLQDSADNPIFISDAELQLAIESHFNPVRSFARRVSL